MRRVGILLAIGAILGIAIVPAEAETLEQVIAKHIEARGGQEAWAKLESMKLTGQFVAFSKVAPFTLQRKRDRRYHMDHLQNEKQVTIAYDGKNAWSDNHWNQPGAMPIEAGPDLDAVLREIDFATALFDYDERGFTAELIGETEIEGIPAIGIKLMRSEDSVDTWYLDPRTYLEIARESPGSDFGRPMPTRTFFDDFRKVEGLVIPHHVEGQWYTRDRVMTVESVELNAEIDDALFRIPAPNGMGPFVGLVGNWKVKTETRQQPGAPWQESEREGNIEAILRGALMQERFVTEGGTEVIWTLSFDSFHEKYRYTAIDGQRNQLDVREGTFDDDGKLVLSNMDTGTTWSGFGMTFHTRVTMFDIGDDAIKVHTELSTDGGENWFLAAKREYTRDQ
jgi:hypothetical protein